MLRGDRVFASHHSKKSFRNAQYKKEPGNTACGFASNHIIAMKLNNYVSIRMYYTVTRQGTYM